VIVVIGGGFIGAEVATQLKSRGFVPIVLEALQRPLIGVLGPDVSSWLERLARTRMSNCAATSTFATLNTAPRDSWFVSRSGNHYTPTR